jgi:hypothetical protein
VIKAAESAAGKAVVIADARRMADSGSYSIDLWHPDLERFGARQLSDRFHARYGTPMTSDAWEGWIAVKAVWETALRVTGGDFAGTLAKGGFDGHKGVALRFGGAERLLRQPLVLVRVDHEGQPERRTLVKEIPWPIAAEDPSQKELPRCAG